jgi:PIN domain nuclease of toxin-antitoxin system
MKVLLDTHTFLWFIDDSPRLSQKGKALLEDDNDLLFGIGSFWEIAIKVSLGKLTVTAPCEVFIMQQLILNEIELLPIKVAHLGVVASLPFHHRDPFDRLLIAQAIVEGVPIVSADEVFDSYPVQRLW